MGNSGLDWALTGTFCVSLKHGGVSPGSACKKGPVDAGHLSLCIEDNGRGLPAAGSPIRQQPGFEQATRAQAEAAAPAGGTGHGLITIERRAFHLGGSHRFGTSALGGASVQIRVPLNQAA